MPNGPAFALGPQDAEFLQIEFLSILAAARGPGNTPFAARALGSRLSADKREVTLLFCSSEARELLEQVAANGAIAAVFAVPATHQALQLKGVDGRVVRLAPDDRKLADSYCQAFTAHLCQMGYQRHLIEAMLAFEPDELAAVTFTPTAEFSQTPGPRAGHAIGEAR